MPIPQLSSILLFLSLCVCLSGTHTTAQAADLGDKETPVDDPIGLGERLALIDYLRDEKQQKIPANPSLKDLRRMYWKLEGAEERSEANLERDRIVRLRHAIEVTYAIITPKESSYAELLAIKAQQEAKAKRELQAFTEKQAQLQDDPNTNVAATDHSADEQLVIKQAAAPNKSGSSQTLQQDSLEGIKKSTILIATKSSTGTGFFIHSKGYLITNRHVVGDDSLGETVQVHWDASLQRKPESFKIIALSKTRDLALLKPVGGGKRYHYFKINTDYEITKDVLIAGFPLAASIGQSLGTNAIDMTITKGAITALRRDNNELQFLQSDASARSGNSGGPLIDFQSNQVLGVVSRTTNPQDSGGHGRTMTFSIPSNDILSEFKSELPYMSR